MEFANRMLAEASGLRPLFPSSPKAGLLVRLRGNCVSATIMIETRLAQFLQVRDDAEANCCEKAAIHVVVASYRFSANAAVAGSVRG